jgi:hypothetical protein
LLAILVVGSIAICAPPKKGVDTDRIAAAFA